MAESARNSYSLRRLLVLRLLTFLLPLAVFVLLGAYFVTLHYADTAFDRALARRVYAVADQVEVIRGKPVVDLPKSAHDILQFDPSDVMFYRVVGPAGEQLAGSKDFPLPVEKKLRPSGQVWFYDTEVDQEEVRVAAYRLSLKGTHAKGSVLVITGETTAKRTRLAEEILLSLLIPMLIVIVLMIYVVSLAVDLSLRPVKALREALANRSPHDLKPIRLKNLPGEIEPLLSEMNSLMGDLRNLHDSRQQFLADAAHQLRTPLASMRAKIELALREAQSEETGKMLSDLLTSMDRQSRLVQQLLALSRTENELNEAQMSEFDLDELTRKVTAEWVPLAMQHKIELAYEPSGTGTPIIRGNEHAINEALSNLLDNVMRYCRSGDSVTVRTESREDQIYLEVCDTGPGVPKETLKKVFARFYRVPGTRMEGCGLGLAIVNQVARTHGGEVEALINEKGGLTIQMCFHRRR